MFSGNIKIIESIKYLIPLHLLQLFVGSHLDPLVGLPTMHTTIRMSTFSKQTTITKDIISLDRGVVTP